MRHIFIINPVAGKHNAKSLIPKIKKYFAENGASYDILLSEYQHHAMELARAEVQKGGEVRLYACGGDGTLFDVVNGAYGYDNAEVGFIPCGSGNDFIKNFGEPDNFMDIDGQIKGSAIAVDLIKFDDFYSINLASMGMDAEIARHKNKRKLLCRISGKLAYNISILTGFILNIKNNFTVTVDDEEPIKGSFLFAVAANGKYYGGEYMPAPNALTNDGLMDIVLVKSVSRFKILSLLPKYRTGEHINIKNLCIIKCGTKMVVEAERDVTVNLDGEIFSCKKAEFNIIKGGIRFILPSLITIKNPDFSKADKLKNALTRPAIAYNNANCSYEAVINNTNNVNKL